MTVELRERLGYRINHKRVERLLRHKAWLMTLSDLESRWAADWSLGPRRNRSVALRRNGFVKASSTVLPHLTGKLTTSVETSTAKAPSLFPKGPLFS